MRRLVIASVRLVASVVLRRGGSLLTPPDSPAQNKKGKTVWPHASLCVKAELPSIPSHEPASTSSIPTHSVCISKTAIICNLICLRSQVSWVLKRAHRLKDWRPLPPSCARCSPGRSGLDGYLVFPRSRQLGFAEARCGGL